MVHLEEKNQLVNFDLGRLDCYGIVLESVCSLLFVLLPLLYVRHFLHAWHVLSSPHSVFHFVSPMLLVSPYPSKAEAWRG